MFNINLNAVPFSSRRTTWAEERKLNTETFGAVLQRTWGSQPLTSRSQLKTFNHLSFFRITVHMVENVQSGNAAHYSKARFV